jgi:hypothetical protein
MNLATSGLDQQRQQEQRSQEFLDQSRPQGIGQLLMLLPHETKLGSFA